MIRVEVIRAWPRRHESVTVELPDGAVLTDALAASGLDLSGIAACAIYGERVTDARLLQPGDRIELLRTLVVDPKQARRTRASLTKT